MKNTQSRDKSFTQNALLANPYDSPFDPWFHWGIGRGAKQFDAAFVSKIAVWVKTFVTTMGNFRHFDIFFHADTT